MTGALAFLRATLGVLTNPAALLLIALAFTGGYFRGEARSDARHNAANLQAQIRQRMADRFKEDFAGFRETLDDAQKRQWDAALAALVNAKRTTLYKLVDGKPQPVMVRVGASDGTDTEVSGGGLEAGDLLVTGERARAAQ